jgi:hypothetical protein
MSSGVSIKDASTPSGQLLQVTNKRALQSARARERELTVCTLPNLTVISQAGRECYVGPCAQIIRRLCQKLDMAAR